MAAPAVRAPVVPALLPPSFLVGLYRRGNGRAIDRDYTLDGKIEFAGAAHAALGDRLR